jgi:hypothetical protein
MAEPTFFVVEDEWIVYLGYLVSDRHYLKGLHSETEGGEYFPGGIILT